MSTQPPISDSNSNATTQNPSSTTAPNNTNSRKTNFNIGTRKSALALKQTDLVLSAATQQCPDYTFTVMARDTAAGDIDKVTPFKDMVVKNIWTHELEMGLREGGLDFLVHSLKGMFLLTYLLSLCVFVSCFLLLLGEGLGVLGRILRAVL